MKAIESKPSLSFVVILFMFVFLLIYFFVPFADTAPINDLQYEDLSSSQKHHTTQIVSRYDNANKIQKSEESFNCAPQWQYQQAIYTFPKGNPLSFQEKVLWTNFRTSSQNKAKTRDCETSSSETHQIRKNTTVLKYNY